MALSSTIYRFTIQLSDVDRGVYEKLELRLAMHPSESLPFLLTRIIAYCLNLQPGLEFTEGISAPDLPAIWAKDLTGLLLLWIDIGNPSARRLHKAAKAAPRICIYTYRDIAILKKEMEGETIHQLKKIEVYALAPSFLDSLAGTLQRDNHWDILRDEAELSITAAGKIFATDLVSHRLGPP